MQLHKLTASAVLVAIGTLSAHLIYIPAGAAKCFPVQHAINVLAAVLLGAHYGVAIAFVTSCLRNILGTGSLLAFPGSMVGAFLAAAAYRRWHKIPAAMLGEVIGTGFLGGLLAWLLAYALLGSKAAAWFFIPPFLLSTCGGSIIAGLLLNSAYLRQAFGSKVGK